MKIFGDHEPRTIEQLERCMDAAEGSAGVLCADGHVGYSQPIGGVVAYREHMSPSGVGYDIGCGNKAVLTNVSLGDVQPDLPRIMDEIFERISFGVGRNDGRAGRPPGHRRDPRRRVRAAARAARRSPPSSSAPSAPATTTSTCSPTSRTASGSACTSARAASATRPRRCSCARRRRAAWTPRPTLLAADSELGAGYAEAMQLAGRYAYAGRDVVCAEVCRILGADALEEVHNHHNYAWREEHGGEEAWVVRKGATPAFPGQRGFVGATMGEPAVILEGVESDAAREALYSTVHGAGRAMSRRKAKRELDFPARSSTSSPREGIELRGGAADEAPGAYKRLDEVLAYHEGTVRILHTLRPIGVAMAGADTFDPYKD